MQLFGIVKNILLISLLSISCSSSSDSTNTNNLHNTKCPENQLPSNLKVSCYKFSVNENNLAVSLLKSENPIGKPVLFLHGGPGGRATADTLKWLLPQSPILARHDLILVDQRGSGLSNPSLDCRELDTTNEEIYDLYKACRDRLINSGIDLTRYRIENITNDLIALRRSMEIDQWNLYSVSYGTRIALELLRIDEAAVSAAVLDSAVPPHITLYDSLYPEVDKSINSTITECVNSKRCSNSFNQEFDSLLSELHANPVLVSTKKNSLSSIDDTAFIQLIISFLAHRPNTEDLISAIKLAINGELAESVSLLEPLTGRGFSIGDETSEGVQLSSECADEIPFNKPSSHSDQAPIIAALEKIEKTVHHLCSIWNVPPSPLTVKEPVHSNAEILILGGHLDLVTPIKWAQSALEYLPNATLIESTKWGHTPSLNSSCASHLVGKFFDGHRPLSGITNC